jgi:hypothetical protein
MAMMPTPPNDEEPKVFVPAGIVLGRDSSGREITVDAVILNPDLIDWIVPETLTIEGVKALFRAAEGKTHE